DARTRIGAAARRIHGARADEVIAVVSFHRVPLNDVWFRDNGPLFVQEGVRRSGRSAGSQAHYSRDANARAPGRVARTDWGFNAWGGKYAPWDDDDRAPLVVADRLGMRRFAAPAIMEGGALEINGRGVCLTTRSCLLEPNRNPDLSEGEIEGLL